MELSRLHVQQVPTSCHLSFKILPHTALYTQCVLWFHEVKSASMERRFWMVIGKEQLSKTPFICGISWGDWLYLWTKNAMGNNMSQNNRQKQVEYLYTAIHQSDVLPSNWTYNSTLQMHCITEWDKDIYYTYCCSFLSGTDEKILPAKTV
jgi:hypothetical protein